MELIWVLFVICGVIPFLLGVIFGGNSDTNNNVNSTNDNTLWSEECESNNHEARVNEELAGLTDHNLGFYHTEV